MRPMLASRGTQVPTGPAWLHEVKWDGMRVLVEVHAGQAHLTSRNGNDVTVAFPEVQALGAALGAAGLDDVVLDAELVAFTDGRPAFAAIADRIHVRDRRRAEQAAAANPATLMLFDLLRLDGRDATGLPLADRRALLESLQLEGPAWRTPPAYDDGPALWEATRDQGLEGVVSKRRSSRYAPGRRSEEWLKFPHRPSGSYVVGGWRPETGSASRLGALLVGEPTVDGLVYRGRVGSGVAGRAAQRLLGLLAAREVEACPFATPVPDVDARGTRWVAPEVVVEVASLGSTPQGRLRQPAFLSVRADLSPSDLVESGGR